MNKDNIAVHSILSNTVGVCLCRLVFWSYHSVGQSPKVNFCILYYDKINKQIILAN